MHELRILAGNPSEEDLAALIVVLMAAASRVEPAGEPPRESHWRTSARPTVPGRPARGAWRAAALPRP